MTLESLYARTELNTNGCREWLLSKNAYGYGKTANGRGGWILAHRAAWVAANGAIPLGEEVCHRCDNRACLRIEHLFIATHAENMRDAKEKGRAAGCPGIKNKKAKLTEDAVRQIRESSESGSVLGRRFNISHVMASRIKRRAAWKHLE